MHRHQAWPGFLQPLDTGLSAMRRAIVHNEKNSLGVAIRGLTHQLCHEPMERGNPCFRFASSKEFGAMHIPSSQVSQGPFPFIFVFDQHRVMGIGGHTGLRAATCLNAGLFIGAEHIVILSKRLTLPDAVV